MGQLVYFVRYYTGFGYFNSVCPRSTVHIPLECSNVLTEYFLLHISVFSNLAMSCLLFNNYHLKIFCLISVSLPYLPYIIFRYALKHSPSFNVLNSFLKVFPLFQSSFIMFLVIPYFYGNIYHPISLLSLILKNPIHFIVI